MSLRPIVIQAQSGRVYFVDDDGGFTAYWSIKHYIFELVVGILFLTLLAIGLYAMRRSRSKSDIGVVSGIEKGAK
jgi:hypothetical protein